MSLPQKVLVANRGEIAVRIIRTVHELGLESVVVYHAADAGSIAVREATEAVEVTGGTPVGAYLNVEAIIEAALRTGADAIHPGFGFLAENASFAQAVGDAGITFVGPPPDAIQAMGDKIRSKALAVKAGVPTVPGSTDAVADADEAVTEADRVGYPVLLKASAGGGGKGMRIANDATECREAFDRASSEAKASFGDGRVFVERYILRPRHIEIQVLADSHGTVLYLGERECSIQRRYQKVIEEAPSPFIDAATRRQMGESAVALARAVGYVSAGTVEMVVDTDRNFYFLEMNTRLQVEHPVTEAITGIDIVAEQLRIAGGEPLGFSQDDVTLTGSAIECRIYAEDADAGFLPATGRLALVRFPAGPGIRVDHGMLEGQEVTAAFDPMIAKVIVHGATRGEPRSSARAARFARHRAARDDHEHGVPRARAGTPGSSQAGNLHTGFLDEHADDARAPPLPTAEEQRILIAAASAGQSALRSALRSARAAGVDGRMEAVK